MDNQVRLVCFTGFCQMDLVSRPPQAVFLAIASLWIVRRIDVRRDSSPTSVNVDSDSPPIPTEHQSVKQPVMRISRKSDAVTPLAGCVAGHEVIPAFHRLGVTGISGAKPTPRLHRTLVKPHRRGTVAHDTGKTAQQKRWFLALNRQKFGRIVWFRGDRTWHYGSRVSPHLRLWLV